MNIYKYFKKDEIKTLTPFSYLYKEKKKIVTYVPLNHVDKLTFELSNAGAGIIGNYDLCSFRMKGVGTFRPKQGSRPFSGEKGKINFVEEIRLEMECDPIHLDAVVEALLKYHPYEEVAYEIYTFTKRDIIDGYSVILNKKRKLSDILKKFNSELEMDNVQELRSVQKLVILERNISEADYNKAKLQNLQVIFIFQKDFIKLIKIT
ncbi:MAG: hypothetical protein ACP5P3_07085 [Ignavibacteria bacterium]